MGLFLRQAGFFSASLVLSLPAQAKCPLDPQEWDVYLNKTKKTLNQARIDWSQSKIENPQLFKIIEDTRKFVGTCRKDAPENIRECTKNLFGYLEQEAKTYHGNSTEGYFGDYTVPYETYLDKIDPGRAALPPFMLSEGFLDALSAVDESGRENARKYLESIRSSGKEFQDMTFGYFESMMGGKRFAIHLPKGKSHPELLVFVGNHTDKPEVYKEITVGFAIGVREKEIGRLDFGREYRLSKGKNSDQYGDKDTQLPHAFKVADRPISSCRGCHMNNGINIVNTTHGTKANQESLARLNHVIDQLQSPVFGKYSPTNIEPSLGTTAENRQKIRDQRYIEWCSKGSFKSGNVDSAKRVAKAMNCASCHTGTHPDPSKLAPGGVRLGVEIFGHRMPPRSVGANLNEEEKTALMYCLEKEYYEDYVDSQGVTHSGVFQGWLTQTTCSPSGSTNAKSTGPGDGRSAEPAR